MKMPVSERALLQRINRKLIPEGEIVHKTRNAAMAREPKFGRYFSVDLAGDFMVDYDVDLEERGRELKVLQDWEELQAQAER